MSRTQVVCPRVRKTSSGEERDERVREAGITAKEWTAVMRVMSRNKRLRQKWARFR